ncbi:hypothetical protein LIER_21030 [Lithospermum erythrorhizon]|uniref:Uncharacterized protein n=1 Tax=Lithospermum erythrorhizon TaxID=34254 RepID=A0AAV3QR67_LITER
MTSNATNGSKPDLSMLEPLDGKNYKRWAQSDTSSPPIDAIVKKNEEDIKKYDKDSKIARYHILNHMVDNLFDLFIVHKSAKLI